MSSQPAVPDSAGTVTILHRAVCVRVQLRSGPSGLDGTCATAGGSPFQACYLLLNKSAAGNRTQSADGQRTSERVKARGLLLPPVAAELCGEREGVGGRGGTV